MIANHTHRRWRNVERDIVDIHRCEADNRKQNLISSPCKSHFAYDDVEMAMKSFDSSIHGTMRRHMNETRRANRERKFRNPESKNDTTKPIAQFCRSHDEIA